MNARSEAIVRLRLRGPAGVEAHINAMVDTGFTASLTIPLTVVTTLGLVRESGGNATLADGSDRPFDMYAAEVDWCGAWRPLLVWAVGSEVLLGMRLLEGHQLRVEATLGGMVEITPLS